MTRFRHKIVVIIFGLVGWTVFVVLQINLGSRPGDDFPVWSSLTGPSLIIDRSETQCSSDWINGTTVQFVAFAVNNFTEVNFMMPGEFVAHQLLYEFKCLFSSRNGQKVTPVQKLGGNSTYDLFHRTVNLRCPIPDQFSRVSDESMMMTFVVTDTEHYNIRICRKYKSFSNGYRSEKNSLSVITEAKSRKHEKTKPRIACCTMVTNGYSDLMKIWIEYNLLLGIDHFYFYDNAAFNETRIHEDLKEYVEQDIVTIVPWYRDTWRGFLFHSTYWVRHQLWSHNDCIRRYGEYYDWLALFDVDEFPVLIDPTLTLTDVLTKIPSKYCSMLLQNCLVLRNDRIQSDLIHHPSRLLNFIQNDLVNLSNCNNRLKHFVRPSNVYYFRIHWLSTTVNCSGSYQANRTHEIRMNHYKASYLRITTSSDATDIKGKRIQFSR